MQRAVCDDVSRLTQCQVLRVFWTWLLKPCMTCEWHRWCIRGGRAPLPSAKWFLLVVTRMMSSCFAVVSFVHLLEHLHLVVLEHLLEHHQLASLPPLATVATLRYSKHRQSSTGCIAQRQWLIGSMCLGGT